MIGGFLAFYKGPFGVIEKWLVIQPLSDGKRKCLWLFYSQTGFYLQLKVFRKNLGNISNNAEDDSEQKDI